MGFLGKNTGTMIKRTATGRAIHTSNNRQPIIVQRGTGYSSNYQPVVPGAAAIRNPLQRYPHSK